MTIPEHKRDSIWRDINLFCRSYIQLQKARVGFGSRIFQLENREAVNVGLLLEITEKKVINEESGKTRRSTTYKPVDDTEETKQAIADLKLSLKETNNIYALLLSHKVRIHRQELDMLDQAKEVIKNLGIVKYCQRVRGMGDVAALILMGYIQPMKPDPNDDYKMKIVRLPELLAYAGIIPGASLKAGEQGKFNPQFKGRVWLIGRNIIMAKDTYYTGIYRIKKDYYTNRPDIIALREDPDPKKRRKASKDHMHKMALRIMNKMVLSHCHEIVLTEYLGKPVSEVDPSYRRHRNTLPLKPVDAFEEEKILERYMRTLANLIEDLNRRWIADKTPDKREYFDFMNHADLD
jgi:hypothetical protein